MQYSHYKEWIKNCGRLLSLFDTLSPKVLYNFKSPSKSIKKQFCLNILIESPKKKHFNTAALKQETDKKTFEKRLSTVTVVMFWPGNKT